MNEVANQSNISNDKPRTVQEIIRAIKEQIRERRLHLPWGT